MKIVVAVPVIRPLPFQTVNSLTSLGLLMRKVDPKVELDVHWISQCSFIDKARNVIASEFLKTDADILVSIDQDIAFNPIDFLRLVKLTQDHPIIGVPYPAKMYPLRQMVQFKEEEDGVPPKPEEFDKDGTIPVYAMGLGFTALRRIVLEKMAEESIKVDFGAPFGWLPYIYKVGPNEKREHKGEDWHFFKFARDLGYIPRMDATISLGHIGDHMYYQQVGVTESEAKGETKRPNLTAELVKNAVQKS